MLNSLDHEARPHHKSNNLSSHVHTMFIFNNVPLMFLDFCNHYTIQFTCSFSFPSARHSLKHSLYFVPGHPQRKGESKDLPVRTVNTYAWVDLQFQSFLNPALDGSDWSAPWSGRFYPRNEEPIALAVYEGRWAPEQVWILWRWEKSFVTTGI